MSPVWRAYRRRSRRLAAELAESRRLLHRTAPLLSALARLVASLREEADMWQRSYETVDREWRAEYVRILRETRTWKERAEAAELLLRAVEVKR